MHGRFLVLFTVVDTGMTFSSTAQSFVVTRPRKASWVLLVSRFAVLVDQACFQADHDDELSGCRDPRLAAQCSGFVCFPHAHALEQCQYRRRQSVALADRLRRQLERFGHG